MHGKWKSLLAFGMAALIGCMIPAGTMLAAEDGEQISSVSDNTITGGGDVIPDENLNPDGVEDGKADTVVNPEEVRTDADAEKDEETNTVPAAGTVQEADAPVVFAAAGAAPTAAGVEEPQSGSVPIIEIQWQGQDQTCQLSDKIAYEYVNNKDQSLSCSAMQGTEPAAFWYYLDNVSDLDAAAKTPDVIQAMNPETTWTKAENSPVSVPLSSDCAYVLYVMTEGDSGYGYARSGGIVVDTEKPEIIGVEDGETYAEGTEFTVQDANLESITINGQAVELAADGKYKVTANGTSCVIYAKDKAGNDVSCSIVVDVQEPGKEPGADNTISEGGRYALTVGTAYQLAEGTWSIFGDKSVYAGGGSFYVKTDGNYIFIKH